MNKCPCVKTLLMESILDNPLGLNVFALDKDYTYLEFSKTHKEIMKHIWGVDIKKGSYILDYISEQSDKIRAKRNFDRALFGEYFSVRENYGSDELHRSSWKNDYSPIYDDNQCIVGVSVFIHDLTNIVKQEKNLKISEIQNEIDKQRKLFLNSIGDGLYGLDLEGKCFFINPSALKTLGFTEDEIIGKNTHNLIHHHKQNGEFFRQEECVVHHSAKNNKQIFQRDWLFKKNGDIFPVDIIITPLIENDTIYGTVVSFRDITTQYNAEEKLKEFNLKLENEKNRYETIMELASDGIHIFDMKGNLIQFNKTFQTMLGYTHNEMERLNVFEWSGIQQKENLNSIILSLLENPKTFETKHKRKDGSMYDAEINAKVIKLNGERYIYASARDITERKIIEQEITKQKKELEKLASIDKLTNIYNRRIIDEFLNQEIEAEKRDSNGLSVIMIDIDHFKNINDIYGHQIGDLVLSQVAKLICENSRKSDIQGRFGGEEFIVICPKTTGEQALVLAQKIRTSIESYKFEEIGTKTISLGISSFEENDTKESLVKKADTALYQAKNSGRNKAVLFETDLKEFQNFFS